MRGLLWCVVGLVFAVACAAPTSSTPQEVFVGEHGPGGDLELHWQLDADRSPLSPSVAQSADSYQLVAFSGSTATMRVLKPGVTNVLTLAAGTWRIVLLAGLKRSSSSSTTFLVGTARAEGVVITEGTRTPLTLTLKAVDAAFALTGSAVWGEQLVVKATGNSRCDVVGMYLAEASADRRPRFRSVELWNGYHEATVSGTPANWAAEVSAKVPEGATDVGVWLVGAQLCLLDATGTWVPAQGLLDGAWEWINRADMADTHALAGQGEQHVAASAPPTGIDVSISWE